MTDEDNILNKVKKFKIFIVSLIHRHNENPDAHSELIGNINDSLAGKSDSNHTHNYVATSQGSGNSGKFLKVNSSGNVACESVTIPAAYSHPSAKQCSYSVDISGKEDSDKKSQDIVTDATSTVKYPSVKAVKDYVDDVIGDIEEDMNS